MAKQTALISIQLFSLASCIGAITAIAPTTREPLELFYLSGWFILGSFCNIAGLISIGIYYGDNERNIDQAHVWLYRHYVLCWLTIILGYPTLVTTFWMTYYPSPLAHSFCILGIAPFLAWLFEWRDWVQAASSVCVSILIVLHVAVCIGAKNWFGVEGSLVMVANLVTLAIPTGRTTVWNISPHEAFVGGVATASLLYAQAVRQMHGNPIRLDSIIPHLNTMFQ